MNNEPLNPNELRELRGLLTRLPDAPVPSNFTARVMQAVELEDARRPHRGNFFSRNWHALLPRFAAAAAVAMVAGFVFYQQGISNRRAALVKSVALVAQAQPLPSVEALQNFDAIRRMNQPVHADEGLLALAPDLQ
jgi:negative regulator of sigma E activity